eukprot:4297296-Pleurochrysis_carterae.AAC.2
MSAQGQLKGVHDLPRRSGCIAAGDYSLGYKHMCRFFAQQAAAKLRRARCLWEGAHTLARPPGTHTIPHVCSLACDLACNLDSARNLARLISPNLGARCAVVRALASLQVRDAG